MTKPTVVLVDPDPTYLAPLEAKFLEEFFDEIELEVITSQEYYNEYFSSPRKIDVLIIGETVFNSSLLRHNITDCFVLTEKNGETVQLEGIISIYKYTSAKEIFNQVYYRSKILQKDLTVHKETQVVVVTSAIGGSGKTTLSLALSSSLSHNHKRVLYISTDIMQGFAYYLDNKTPLSNDIVRVFAGTDELLYQNLRPFLRFEGFTYLPPFMRSIRSLGLEDGIYNRIIAAAKESKEFDYIIVDTDPDLDEAKAEMLHEADMVIINVLQDGYAAYKTEFLTHNLDCRNKEKFAFVCNRFRRDVDNEFIDSPVGQQFMIAEYIDEVPLYRIHSLDSFTELTAVRNLAYSFS